MRTSSVVISVLALALVATNVAWVSKLSAAKSVLEKKGYLYRAERAGSKAARDLLPNVICAGTTKGDLMAATLRLDPSALPKEGDGFTWAGPLGFRFDSTGRLVEVQQMSAGIID